MEAVGAGRCGECSLSPYFDSSSFLALSSGSIPVNARAGPRPGSRAAIMNSFAAAAAGPEWGGHHTIDTRRGNYRSPAKIGQPVLQPGTIRSALDTVWTVWAGYDCLYPPSGHQRTPQHGYQSPAGGRQGREPGASFHYHFLLSQQQTRVTNIRINHTTNPNQKPKLSTAICNSI